jgi:hypothetical protein
MTQARENEVDRMWRLYVEDPYVWISPFEAYAQTQYEMVKQEKDLRRLKDEVARLADFEHARRGSLKEKILDLEVKIFAVERIEGAF